MGDQSESKLKIVGTGSVVGRRRVTNAELARMVRNFDRERAGMEFEPWVVQVTGIESRNFVDGETAEDLMVKAAEAALGAAGLDPADLDLIIAVCQTPKEFVPDAASTVGNALSLQSIVGFNMYAACAGFIYGLEDAYFRIASGKYQTILLVTGDTLSRYLDFDDPRTAVLFADGAAAVVLQPSDHGIGRPFFVGAEYSRHISALQEEKRITMEGGPRVLAKAVRAMAGSVEALFADPRNPYRLEDVDWVLPHNANIRIIENLPQRVGIPLEKFAHTIATDGNLSATSIPRSLDVYVRSGQIERGDVLLMTAVGGGYKFGAAIGEY